MNAFSTNGMLGALRLTRQGQLKAALAALRGKAAEAPVSPAGFVPPQAPASLADALGQLRRSPLLQGLPGLPGFPGLQSLVPNPPPEGSRFENREFANAAGSRKYKLFIPAGYNGKPMPLVVMLHGCTQSPDDFAAGTMMNEIASEQGFIVAYPAQAGSANITKCWNWYNPADQQRDRGEPSIIAGITRQIIGEFAVRPDKVFVAGLSAGGAAAAVLGDAYPDLFAAIGVHSGLACGVASDLPSALAAMRHGGELPVQRGGELPVQRGGQPPIRPGGQPPIRPGRSGASAIMPTIVFHGDRDSTVNIANAAQVIAQSKGDAQLRIDSIQGATAGMDYTRTVQSTDAGKPVLEAWVLHGAGHAWSGGSPTGSFTQQKGPNASREMLRFFLQQ